MGNTLAEISARGAIHFALGTLSISAIGCGDEQAEQGPKPLTLEIRVNDVAPGVENTQCIKARLPNTGPIAIGRIVNEISSSSHHFVVSTINEENAGDERLDPFDCRPFQAPLLGAPLAITQKHLDAYPMPPGVGYAFAPNQMVHLELHYINRTKAPVNITAHTSLYPLAEGELENEASVLLVGDLKVAIPGDSEHTLGPNYQALPPAFDGVNVFAVTGHTHRFGTNVSVGTAPSIDGPVTSRYEIEHFVWDEPEVVAFSPAFQVPSGGGFTYSCSWKNTTHDPIVFGESANEEMCFFWAYYYPKKTGGAVLLTPAPKL